MRPSWPAPTMPSFIVGESSLRRIDHSWFGQSGIRLGQHLRRLVRAEFLERRVDLGTLVREDRGGGEAGVRGARDADGKRRNGNSGGHLHDRQQRIEAIES